MAAKRLMAEVVVIIRERGISTSPKVSPREGDDYSPRALDEDITQNEHFKTYQKELRGLLTVLKREGTCNAKFYELKFRENFLDTVRRKTVPKA